MGLADFVGSALGRESFFRRPDPEFAERMAVVFGVHSVDDLLAMREPEVFQWTYTGGHQKSSRVRLESARAAYDAGASLYFRSVQEFSEIEREIAEALGAPVASTKCEVICSRRGSGSKPHFDASDVIVVQLAGRKTWRVAPNHFAPVPLGGWQLGDPVSPALRLYAPDAPPSSMPDTFVTYEMTAGSVLHVPRGHWHDTASDDDSLSMHFNILPATRIDVALTMLRNELMRDAWWRESVYETGAHAQRRDIDHVGLREIVGRLDFRDAARMPVAERPADPATRFVRCAQASVAIQERSSSNGVARLAISNYRHLDTQTFQVEVPAPLVSACSWVNALPAGAAFDLARLREAAPELSATEARDLLLLLEQMYVVRRP